MAGEALSYFYYKVLLEGLKKFYRAIYLIAAEKQLNVITLAQKIFSYISIKRMIIRLLQTIKDELK